jgi:hypothetical protein
MAPLPPTFYSKQTPSISQKAIRAMHLPYETEVIRQVRNKRKGFLFWTGGVYAGASKRGVKRFFADRPAAGVNTAASYAV